MSKTIIVGVLELEVSDWNEAPIVRPAGWEQGAQAAHEEDMRRQGFIVLQPGEVSFTCVITQSEGTNFILKEDGRSFVVTFLSGTMHRARGT